MGLAAPDPHDMAGFQHSDTKVHLLPLVHETGAKALEPEKHVASHGVRRPRKTERRESTLSRCFKCNLRSLVDIDKRNRHRTDARIVELGERLPDGVTRRKCRIIIDGDENRCGRKLCALVSPRDVPRGLVKMLQADGWKFAPHHLCCTVIGTVIEHQNFEPDVLV